MMCEISHLALHGFALSQRQDLSSRVGGPLGSPQGPGLGEAAALEYSIRLAGLPGCDLTQLQDRVMAVRPEAQSLAQEHGHDMHAGSA